MIISIGYRINSKTATDLHMWATSTLRARIVEGVTINRKRTGDNYAIAKTSIVRRSGLLVVE